MANTSLVMGILSIIFSTLGFIQSISWMGYIGLALGVIGLILSIIALTHHRNEGKLGKRAIWGMVFSIIGIVEWIIGLIIYSSKPAV